MFLVCPTLQCVAKPKREQAMLYRLFILTIVANMLLLGGFPLNAYGQSSKTPVVMALADVPVTLDSRFSTGASASRITQLLSLPLVKIGDDFTPKAAAAISFSQPTALSVRFVLGDYTFVNGTALTAQHVKDYYENLRNPKTGSPFSWLLRNVSEIVVEDNKVIVFNLINPDPFVWTLFTRPLMLPDVGLGNDNAAIRPVGLGPYMVEEGSTPVQLSLKLSSYWAGELPASERITFKVVKDPLVRLLKVQRGEAHIMQNDMPTVFFADAKEKGELKHQTAQSSNYTYLGFNFDDEFTGNKAVREAIAYAIDRKLIMDTLLYGLARPAPSLLPNSHPAFWDAPLRKHNIKKAINILDKAGLKADQNGIRLHLRFSTTNNPSTLLLVQAIQHQLKEVGIELDINISEWGTFYGNIKKGNFQMYLLTWVGKYDADIYRSVFHSKSMPPNGANRGRYQNPIMDRFIDKLWSAPEKLAETAQAIQILQHQDIIYIPLWRRDNMVLHSPKLKGFIPQLDGSYEGLLKAAVK